jgi:hypothetical protein
MERKDCRDELSRVKRNITLFIDLFKGSESFESNDRLAIINAIGGSNYG